MAMSLEPFLQSPKNVYSDICDLKNPKFEHCVRINIFLFKGVLTKNMTDLNASGPNYLL
jgi:hypothetical protein